MYSFEELEVWKFAGQYHLIKIAGNFHSEEKFRLADELIRCTRLITDNIAEGFGRFHRLLKIENAKCLKLLNRYISYLKKAKSSGGPKTNKSSISSNPIT